MLALSSSYCYSEETTGTTPNAAANGLFWSMDNILPPEAGLVVNGMFYRYTTEKDPFSDLTVTIQNEHAFDDGFVIQETDDWSQLPGGTINKRVELNNIPKEIIGNGSIVTEGEGTVSDPSVVYSYKFDECYIVLSSPSCPGYDQALYDWLKENGFLDRAPNPEDPYYNEWVQLMLSREADLDDEDDDENDEVVLNEDEEEKDETIEAMNAVIDVEGFIDGAVQAAKIAALSTIKNFEAYQSRSIPGGEYKDAVTLEDGNIQDNQRALSNLAQDNVHRSMVRSQYD